MTEFAKLRDHVQSRLAMINTMGAFRSTVTSQECVVLYSASFKAADNPIFRKRREHDCNCCNHFIRKVGNIVGVDNDGEVISIWDHYPHDDKYTPVANALSARLRGATIKSIAYHEKEFPVSGSGPTPDNDLTLSPRIVWDHFHFDATGLLNTVTGAEGMENVATETYNVFLRGLADITPYAVKTVMELIEAKQLYRGPAVAANVKIFEEYRANSRKLNGSYKELREFRKVMIDDEVTSRSVLKLRNTAVGTLLVSLSSGESLEDAVNAYNLFTDPTNYKQSKSVVTKSMVDSAKKTIDEGGYTSALMRRHARFEDVPLSAVLYKRSMSAMLSVDPFDNVKVAERPRLTVPAPIPISEVMKDMNGLELFFEDRLTKNVVSVTTAVDEDAKPLFSWGNNFAWSYASGTADAIQERVKQAGGRVEGDLRFSLAWECVDDLDLHLRVEGAKISDIYFGNKVHGWGALDVDMNNGFSTLSQAPVENIIIPKIANLPPRNWEVIVHNYNARSMGVQKGRVQISYMGATYMLEVPKLGRGQHHVVARLQRSPSGRVWRIEDNKGNVLQAGSYLGPSSVVHGLTTNRFVPVDLVIKSPNFWEKAIGNEHLFFLMSDCKVKEELRGTHNEFLVEELQPIRKVMQTLSESNPVAPSDRQLSGLGFSVSLREKVIARQNGHVFEIQF